MDDLHSQWQRFKTGELSAVEMAELLLASEPTAPPESTVRIDTDRRRRCGYAEVVYAAGKTQTQLIAAIEGVLSNTATQEVLATRVTVEQAAAVETQFRGCRWHPPAATLRINATGQPILSPSRLAEDAIRDNRRILVNVVAAGTTDAPVVEEARETLAWMGLPSRAIVDVGVAGLHRILRQLPALRSAAVNIVVAGMEGALASVVGGLVATPVIAVPTSVGYGANFGGVAALLSMLNSCSANVCAVNIDSGFKAAYLAGLICDQVHQVDASA